MNTPQHSYLGNYILGQFVPVTDSNGEIQSRNPGDLDAPVTTCAFNFEQVNEAVLAATRGWVPWKRLAVSDRLSAINQYKTQLGKNADSLADLVCLETGKPLWEAKREVAETLAIIEYYLQLAKDTQLETHSQTPGESFATRVNHYPRGVVAVVAPGISPVSDSHLHFIPALAYGNTVVLKASRFAPLVGQKIAQLMHEAGMPAGVFNLLQGDTEVARRLVSHSEVQVVLYTGSYETGQKVQKQIVSDYWKTAVLDMVGKNGVLIWDDAHYQQALLETVYSAFLTSGQRRTTASRVLVHKSLLTRFQSDFHALAKKVSVGYGYTPSPDSPFMGPLLNDEAVENYIRYQGIAVREGCEEIMRGKSLERKPKGHYVSPSIHLVSKAEPKSVYQKTEIFGPNVALYAVEDLEEAIEVLNLSQHGLVASIYTQKKEIYLRACENVRVGTMHWNRHTHTETYRLPKGGLKKSGNSRVMGNLAWQQCTYPVASTENLAQWDPATLPPSLLKAEV